MERENLKERNTCLKAGGRLRFFKFIILRHPILMIKPTLILVTIDHNHVFRMVGGHFDQLFDNVRSGSLFDRSNLFTLSGNAGC